MAENTISSVVGKDTDYLTPDKVEERKEARRQQFGVDENEERGNWTGRFDFLLSCLGWAVGLGNVWRFPYLCYKHGGGAFLIPYVIMLIGCGIPLFFLELSLGQFCSQGPLTCWKFAPLFKGIGVAQLILSMLVTIYYTMIIAWAFFYLCASFTATLPWNDCNLNNSWIDEHCSRLYPFVKCNETEGYINYPNATCYQHGEFIGVTNFTIFDNSSGIIRQSPSEQYFNRRMLRISDGIHHTGGIQWDLALCLLAVWIISFLCLVKGIKSSGKVVYVTAIFPYVVLFILLIRGATLPGSLQGIKYFLNPKWENLKDPWLWYDAANQIFYSLGAGSGGLMALASYNRFHNNCLRDALFVSIANCATSIFAGFVIFSFIGFMSLQLHTTIDHVAVQGTGLAFVIYPDAVTHLPISPLWSALFFIMLISLGLDSQFVGIEVVTTCLVDQFSWLRLHKTKLLAALCFLLYILGLPLCSNGGAYILQLMDLYCGGWALFVIGLCECVSIAFVYGAGRFCKDIETMIGYSRSFIWWRICWQIFTPLLISFVLVFFFVRHEPPKYGEHYFYPSWADALGWCMTISSIIWIPVIAIIKIIRHNGPLLHRLRLLTMPKAEWGPSLVKHRQLIKHVEGFVEDPYGNAAVSPPGIYDNPAMVYSINSSSTAVPAVKEVETSFTKIGMAEAQNEANHATQYRTMAHGVTLADPGELHINYQNGDMLPDGTKLNFSTI